MHVRACTCVPVWSNVPRRDRWPRLSLHLAANQYRVHTVPNPRKISTQVFVGGTVILEAILRFIRRSFALSGSPSLYPEVLAASLLAWREWPCGRESSVFVKFYLFHLYLSDVTFFLIDSVSLLTEMGVGFNKDFVFSSPELLCPPHPCNRDVAKCAVTGGTGVIRAAETERPQTASRACCSADN